MKLKHLIATILLVGLIVAVYPVAAPITNLVSNGSFESPVVTSTYNWSIYSSIPGWTIAWMPSVPSDKPANAYIELQKNGWRTWNGMGEWTAAEGSQWAEMDSDWYQPPLNTGWNNGSSIAIYQNVSTTPGGVYKLRFAYSPRPQHRDNILTVIWDSVTIDTINSDGTTLNALQWTYKEYTVNGAAVGSSTELRFEEAGTADDKGTLLDDVSVILDYVIPEFPLGTMAGLSVCLLALVVIRYKHRMIRQPTPVLSR